MHQLPVEILEEIFARLSTEYFVQLRCVSKQWNKIVGDPKVIQKQLHRQMMRVGGGVIAAEELKVLYLRKHHGPKFCARISKHVIDMRMPSAYDLQCCCNGLYCFSTLCPNPTTVLYNPLTGEALELPSAPQLSGTISMSRYGLGFDAKNDKYKVVRVEMTRGIRRAQVLILGEECWKQVELPSPLDTLECYHAPASLFLNGTLFRVVQISPRPCMIVSGFDIEKEVFSSFDVPFEGCAEVMEIGGCVALPQFQDLPSNVTNIWVLKNNSNNNYSSNVAEWSVQYRIQHDYGLASTRSPGAVRHIMQVGVWKMDQAIFRSGDFVSINIRSGDTAELMGYEANDWFDGTQRLFKIPLSLFPLSQYSARSVQYRQIQMHHPVMQAIASN